MRAVHVGSHAPTMPVSSAVSQEQLESIKTFFYMTHAGGPGDDELVERSRAAAAAAAPTPAGMSMEPAGDVISQIDFDPTFLNNVRLVARPSWQPHAIRPASLAAARPRSAHLCPLPVTRTHPWIARRGRWHSPGTWAPTRRWSPSPAASTAWPASASQCRRAVVGMAPRSRPSGGSCGCPCGPVDPGGASAAGRRLGKAGGSVQTTLSRMARRRLVPFSPLLRRMSVQAWGALADQVMLQLRKGTPVGIRRCGRRRPGGL